MTASTKRILVGTAGWTDKTLIDSGRFYPPDAKSAESRLQYYASQFPMVEVDSSYYGMPSEHTAALWVERTPSGFTLDIKAFSALTQHPTPLRALPKDLREALPAALAEKKNVYYKDLPAEVREAVWERFAAALVPIADAGRLGVVLFQFPPWFLPGRESRAYIEEIKDRLARYTPAIEFRNPYWLAEDNLEHTLGFLRSKKLPFVCVDEPQGTRASVPPVVSCTGPIALVRFHGHNREAWTKRGATVAEKYDYLYSMDELSAWAPRIERLADDARETHAIMNNCHDDKAVRNARELAAILGQSPPLPGPGQRRLL
ncbi:MAG TPA: DUF72 domain-containing protein [Dehalococcoidia bacterium]|nr:DUF72 domain-containing protein [Dehalococcoidia bacterium]